jgi:hypothetical protein
MSKKLLEESTIRQFMKLASLEPLSEAFFEEGRKGKDMREEDMREELSDEEKKKVAAAADKAAAPIEKGMKGTGKPVKEEMGDFDPITQELPVDIPDDTTNTDDMAMMEEELDALFEEEHMSEMGMREEDVEMEVEEGDMEAEINITPDQARAIIAVADMLKDIMPDLEEIETPEGEEEEEETEELAESILRNVTARLRELKNK